MVDNVGIEGGHRVDLLREQSEEPVEPGPVARPVCFTMTRQTRDARARGQNAHGALQILLVVCVAAEVAPGASSALGARRELVGIHSREGGVEHCVLGFCDCSVRVVNRERGVFPRRCRRFSARHSDRGWLAGVVDLYV